MKKIIISIIFALCLFLPVQAMAAETLDQLEAKAKANREAYQKAKEQKALSEQERAEATKQKEQVQADIKQINVDIKKAQDEITELSKQIDVKDKEIKNLMKFVQVSNGESAYLEYAFGASSFTDFIYRVSVAEQLSDYNEVLIKEYNESIKKLEQKQKELTAKQNELAKKEQQLTELEAKLTKEIESLQEGMLTKDREYKTTIDLVNSMKRMGCKGSWTQAQCIANQKPRVSSSVSVTGVTLTSPNGTYMPIARGRITSDFGYRSGGFHNGIDISNGNYGDNIYPIASGKVMLVQSPGTYTEGGRNCGNWIVYVLHNINGHAYVTSYWHLASASVSNGQMVTPNSVIGKMGGLHSVDQCAYGVHVHLNLFDGNTWNIRYPNSGRINPRIVMPQMPGQGVYFTR